MEGVRIASEPWQQGFAFIEDHLEDAIADLARLISFNTAFPPGNGYPAFVDALQAMVEPLGFACEKVNVPERLWHVPNGPAYGERVNLIARWHGQKPVLGLYYHMDTVPAAAGWQRPAYQLTQEDDRLYGLGAADMKGAIAATLLCLRAMRATNVGLAYSPQLLFCTDEEAGLYPGIRYLAENGYLKGHIINFNGSAAPRIWAGCFGLFSLLVRFKGRMTHAGEIKGRLGVNAIEAALPAMNALKTLQGKVAEFVSYLPAPPGHAGGLRPSLTFSAAHGSGCAGQIPEIFDVVVTRRYAPEEDFASIRCEIEETIRQNSDAVHGLSIEIDMISHLIPTDDPEGPHWPRWQKALCAGFGYRAEDFAKWGASSCSDFGYVQRAGVMREIILSGLIRPDSNVHSPEEFTTSGDLCRLAKSIFAYLAQDFAPEINPDRFAECSEGE